MRFIPVLLIALILLAPAVVQAQGQLPCRLYGAITMDGAPVPAGTVITVIVESDVYTTTRAAGSSSYEIKVTPPAGKHYPEGAEITFWIGDKQAAQTAGWETGGNLQVNLTASTMPTPTPTPEPTPEPTPTPAPTPDPTPEPTPEPTPTPADDSGSAGKTATMVIFGIIGFGLIGVTLYFASRSISQR